MSRYEHMYVTTLTYFFVYEYLCFVPDNPTADDDALPAAPQDDALALVDLTSSSEPSSQVATARDNDHLVVLSLLPDSRWRNLLHLDIIRVSFHSAALRCCLLTFFCLSTIYNTDSVFIPIEEEQADSSAATHREGAILPAE